MIYKLKKIKLLFGNELIYIISDIFVKAVAFLSLPFFVNIMTTAEFGEFSLYQTYSSIFTIFFSLNIQQGIVRYYFDFEEKEKHLTTAVYINILVGIMLSIILIIVELTIGIFSIPIQLIGNICIVSISTGIIGVGLENFRAKFNAVVYGLLSITYSLLSTIIGLIFVYSMTSNLGYWRFISITISSVVIGIIVIFLLIKEHGLTYSVETTKYLLHFSIPLIPYTLSTTVISQINRFFLSDLGMVEVGIYSFASNLSVLIYIIAISINRAYQPIFFKSVKDGANYKRKLLRNVLSFYFFYIGFLIFNPLLIKMLGNDSYLVAAKAIPIISLGYGFFYMYSISVNYLYYYKKNRIISLFSIISAIIVIISNAYLIPIFGYYGAAWSTVISYLILFVMNFLYLRRHLRVTDINSLYIVCFFTMLCLPVIISLI